MIKLLSLFNFLVLKLVRILIFNKSPNYIILYTIPQRKFKIINHCFIQCITLYIIKRRVRCRVRYVLTTEYYILQLHTLQFLDQMLRAKNYLKNNSNY